jgi:hypothetical protein
LHKHVTQELPVAIFTITVFSLPVMGHMHILGDFEIQKYIL